MGKDIRQDIKGKRTSHLSSPVGSDTEFHLRDKETGMKPTVGKNYWVCFPVQCSSAAEPGEEGLEDVEMSRYVQLGKPIVEDRGEKENLDSKISKVTKSLRRKE